MYLYPHMITVIMKNILAFEIGCFLFTCMHLSYKTFIPFKRPISKLLSSFFHQESGPEQEESRRLEPPDVRLLHWPR